jgi:hypothetical protein
MAGSTPRRGEASAQHHGTCREALRARARRRGGTGASAGTPDARGHLLAVAERIGLRVRRWLPHLLGLVRSAVLPALRVLVRSPRVARLPRALVSRPRVPSLALGDVVEVDLVTPILTRPGRQGPSGGASLSHCAASPTCSALKHCATSPTGSKLGGSALSMVGTEAGDSGCTPQALSAHIATRAVGALRIMSLVPPWHRCHGWDVFQQAASRTSERGVDMP